MDIRKEKDRIERALALAEAQRPAYAGLYPLLKPLFLLQTEMKAKLNLDPVAATPEAVEAKWRKGDPLIKRWDFPIDAAAAESLLRAMEGHVPADNQALKTGLRALLHALDTHPHEKATLWRSFLQHEMEPWEQWVDAGDADAASLLFWARNGNRPSIEWTAERLLERFPLPKEWSKGYCSVCGSLPSLLFMEGEGERKAYCSWCGTVWGLHRLQCPQCDNRAHESLGYLYVEAEPQHRIQYCNLCKVYFKLIDVRERLEPPYLPLEEWTTLHLDLIAQRAGWRQPSSPAPAIYGASEA